MTFNVNLINNTNLNLRFTIHQFTIDLNFDMNLKKTSKVDVDVSIGVAYFDRPSNNSNNIIFS